MKKLLIISSFLLLGLTSCNKEEKSIKQDSLPINKSDSAIYHTFSVDGKPFLVKQIGDNYYISDDVMISKRQLNVIKNIKSSNGGKISSIRKGTHSDFIYKWTNGILYYKIESSRRSQILQAFSMIEAKSNLLREQINKSTLHLLMIQVRVPHIVHTLEWKPVQIRLLHFIQLKDLEQ